ncbi:hypothetical protein GQR58_022291 [Nymphon striatum]|nr:hypothetical protein GQR58_022291 [Nymphon striatum]
MDGVIVGTHIFLNDIDPSFITSWCNVADDSGIYLPMLDYTRSYQAVFILALGSENIEGKLSAINLKNGFYEIIIPLPNTILHMVGSGQPLKNLAGIFRYAASSNVCSNKDLTAINTYSDSLPA